MNHYPATTTMPYGNRMPGYDTVGCSCNIAIANVPWQYLNTLYEPEQALRNGTAFPELNKPFTGRSVRRP